LSFFVLIGTSRSFSSCIEF